MSIIRHVNSCGGLVNAFSDGGARTAAGRRSMAPYDEKIPSMSSMPARLESSMTPVLRARLGSARPVAQIRRTYRYSPQDLQYGAYESFWVPQWGHFQLELSFFAGLAAEGPTLVGPFPGACRLETSFVRDRSLTME